MNNPDYNLYYKLLIIVVLIFGFLLKIFYRIPKFNPKGQYDDPDVPLSKLLKLLLIGAISFVVLGIFFTAIISLSLYLMKH